MCVSTTAAIVNAALLEQTDRDVPVRALCDVLNRLKYDYHVNFAHGIFARWFGLLCSAILQDYGRSLIYMNGAAYHKYVEIEKPTTTWRKGDTPA
ncbi:hypothetical protein PybrP1_006466 [[Pythium] brassicae (nom. inval.)]|nr:hypothetical protein PybrP1_006466 [[Pythium] brassicae (nom. inval.)]